LDQLRNALKTAGMQDTGKAAATPVAAPLGEDPRDSVWVRLLGQLTDVPKGSSTGHLEQLLHKTVKQLKGSGRTREARELKDHHGSWRKKVDKEAWAAVKRRFAELELSEKTYRAVKQSGRDPSKLLQKLQTRRAAEYRGASAKRAQAWLLG